MGEGVAKQHGHRPGACVLCSQQETEHLRETFPPGSCRGDLGLRPSLMIVLGLHVAGSCSSIEDMILCSNRSPLSEDPGDQFLLDISARKKNLSLLINWYISFYQRTLGGQSEYLGWVSRDGEFLLFSLLYLPWRSINYVPRHRTKCTTGTFSLLLKVGSSDQQQRHHLGACQKHRISGSSRELLNPNLYFNKMAR